MARIVFDGNSQTVGQNGGSVNYPTQTLEALAAGHTQSNLGVGGQTTPQMTADGVAQVDPLYAAVTSEALFVWEGTNDLYFGASAATALANLVSYCTARKAAGWKVVLLTVLPRTNAGTPAGFEASRLAVNADLRSAFPRLSALYPRVRRAGAGTSWADVLVDVAGISALASPADTTYYVDLVHLTVAGDTLIAADAANGYRQLSVASQAAVGSGLGLRRGGRP